MAKRKRDILTEPSIAHSISPKKTKAASLSSLEPLITVQIVTGSYDRVLHGITVTLAHDEDAEFADTFLFNAHGSAIRCLALSPPSAPIPHQTQKVILATGSTDERVNLYHLSAHTPTKITIPAIPSLTSRPVVENPQNRELGSLLHHSSTVSALYFPTRSKLLSSAEDSTIAVTRTRDWSLLSTIKAPIPKAFGRPSGDTSPNGGAPSGVNHFAVHSSMRLMITVSKGEKCMRLWNLVTGKKAGVLNFEKDILVQVGESKYSTGEGRKVAWGSTDSGDEFCVVFERGVLVFGMDSKPKCKIIPNPRTKLHQICYFITGPGKDAQLMAISTDDGRILFYSTSSSDLISSEAGQNGEKPLPSARLIAEIGGKQAGITGRIKDFTLLNIGKAYLAIAGSSDGSLRVWKYFPEDLISQRQPKQIGKLLGTYETNNRITCLQAFVMLPPAVETLHEHADEGEEDAESKGSDSE